jgi:hypothetical protein
VLFSIAAWSFVLCLLILVVGGLILLLESYVPVMVMSQLRVVYTLIASILGVFWFFGKVLEIVVSRRFNRLEKRIRELRGSVDDSAEEFPSA